jgi:hypothetical protein
MRRERLVKIFVGSPDEVERRANDLLAEKAVVLADRVRVTHWGTDPVSMVVLVERDPDDPDVEAHYREIAERIMS